LHRGTPAGKWTCSLCGADGPGGVRHFYLHYMREHYGPAEDARRDG